jgi:hypothetical protein
MGKKQTIRLNESQLRRIVKESVENILNETENPYYPEYTTTDEIRTILYDLKFALISYVSRYKMYPCTGQILDYIKYKFDEVLSGRFRKVYPMSQTPNT